MAVHSQMFSPNGFLIHAQTIAEVVNFFFFFGGGWGGISLFEFVSKRLVSKQIGIKMTGLVSQSLRELWQLQLYTQRKYIKNKQTGQMSLNDKTMVLNSICELSWLFSVSP